jgi:hypothetical protein
MSGPRHKDMRHIAQLGFPYWEYNHPGEFRALSNPVQ